MPSEVRGTGRGARGAGGPAPRARYPAPLRALWRLPRLALVGVVRLYQGAVSPWLPATCRYTPTCSEYAVQALRQYGALRGGVLALWRIGRCNPWGGHGYDPPRWFGEPPPGGPRPGEPPPGGPGTDRTGLG